MFLPHPRVGVNPLGVFKSVYLAPQWGNVFILHIYIFGAPIVRCKYLLHFAFTMLHCHSIAKKINHIQIQLFQLCCQLSKVPFNELNEFCSNKQAGPLFRFAQLVGPMRHVQHL